MRLYHVTTKRVHGDIVREGIDPRYSRGKLRVSWFVVGSKIAWAMMHVMRRRGVGMEQLVAFEADIPRELLVRRFRGAYSCGHIVTPTNTYDLDMQTTDPAE